MIIYFALVRNGRREVEREEWWVKIGGWVVAEQYISRGVEVGSESDHRIVLYNTNRGPTRPPRPPLGKRAKSFEIIFNNVHTKMSIVLHTNF